jgi:hypothetical protein
MAMQKGEWSWLRFSVREVAALVGKSVPMVSRDVRLGLLDRRDLASVVRYVSGRFETGVSPELRAAYLRLGIELGIDKVQPAELAPGPKEPIMLLHSIHKKRKRKESLNPGTVPTVPPGTPQSL